jgi:hypothetical protein
LDEFERRVAEINCLNFSLGGMTRRNLERFERASASREFEGDWLPELYVGLVRLRRLLDAKAPKRILAREAKQRVKALEENSACLPKKVFSPGEARALFEKAGFAIAGTHTVRDNRGLPLALFVKAFAAK